MKQKIYLSLVVLSFNAIAQTPIGSPPPFAGNPNQAVTTSNFSWYRGGNFAGGPAANNNIFGTAAGFNSPIYTITNGLQRTKLNGTQTANIAGVAQNVDGYFGISPTGYFGQPGNTPWAMLHLDGPNNTPWGGDWRRWMRTGTFMRENSDAMYVGLKQEAGTNRSDAVVNWSDDANSAGGPDALRFIFTSTSDGNGGGNTNPLASSSLNGYEYMRMTPFPGITNSTGLPVGHVGIGPLFSTTQLPQNRLHMHAENSLPNYMQISNQIATGQTANDGFHIGISTNGTAEVIQKENLDLRFYTFNTQQAVIKNTGWIGFNTNTPGNELEITSRTTTPYGLNGSGLRFTNMKSTAAPIANPGTGVLSVDANGDVIYVPSSGIANANNGISVNAGVVQLGVDCNASAATKINNRLLTSRFVHLGGNNLIFGDGGSVGIGNPVSTFFSCIVNNKLQITSTAGNPYFSTGNASGLRFVNLTSVSPVVANGTNGVDNTKVLSVDENGDVVLINGGGSINADNGLSTDGPTLGAIHLGQSIGGTGGQLLDDREIPFNSHNILFSGNNPLGTSRIYVGQVPLATNLGAKFYTYNEVEANGMYSEMNGDNTPPFDFDLAVRTGLRLKNAIHGNIHSTNTGPGACVGVLGESNSEYTAIGVSGFATSSSAITYGVMGRTEGTGNNSFAGSFVANGNVSGINYGVYADAANGAINYAGYFVGDVIRTGNDNFTSDQNLKQNIDTITNALGIINQLKPKTFEYKQSSYPSMHLPSGKQYGLIAQEVQTVLPELVNNNVHPAKLDSIGNVVIPSVNYLSLEYQQLIGILIKGMQEQQAKIDSLTTKLNSKDSIQDSRLAALENAINQCCQNAAARNANPNINQLDVELSDKDAIVLNQNVPNPFAEQTTITYNVPESVGKAQIIFYNANGQIIQTVDVKTRGKGKVNVFASDLSSGLYHYTLVADGKVVDSKKMVRE